MTDSLRPSNDLEVALSAAVERGDLEGYLQVLRGAAVVLPSPGGELGPGPKNWPSSTIHGRRHVPVFTSYEAMLADPGLRQAPHTERTLPELAKMWPDPSWGLAVNPGSSLAVCVPGTYVLSTGFRLGAADPLSVLQLPDIQEDGFAEIRTGRLAAENPVEQGLLQAITTGDPELALRALFGGPLFLISTEKDGYTVPGQPGFRWLTMDGREGTVVPVFTSRDRVHQGLGVNTYTKLPVRLLDLSEAWPDDEFGIVINPGTPLTVRLPGPGVLGLPGLADKLGLRPTDSDFNPGAEPDQAKFDVAAVALHLHHQPGVQINSPDQGDHMLLAAAANGDRAGYLNVLLRMSVRLPVLDGQDPGARYGGQPFPWRTVQVNGRTTVEVFTSPVLQRSSGTSSRSGAELHNLLRYWPDPSWDLAINPGTPLCAVLPGEQVAALSEWRDQAVAHELFESFPVGERLDLQLLDASRRGDREGFLEILRPAKLTLMSQDRTLDWKTPPNDPRFPWEPVSLRGRPSVRAYTSSGWARDTAASGKTVRAGFAELAAHWPAADPDFVLNPASPISITLTAAELRSFAGG